HDLPIEELARFAKKERVTGQVTAASWRFDLPLSFDPAQLRMDSHYDVRDLKAGGLAIDHAEAIGSLDHGQVKFDPIVAVSGTGKVIAKAEYDFSDPTRAQAEVQIDKF